MPWSLFDWNVLNKLEGFHERNLQVLVKWGPNYSVQLTFTRFELRTNRTESEGYALEYFPVLTFKYSYGHRGEIR